MGEKKRLGKCKRSSSWVWEENKYRSKMTEEVG